ncbi:hypothetical protein D3C78_1568370 [compost metagenome]
MGKIVIHRNAMSFTAQFQTAASIDKLTERATGIGWQHTNVARGGNGHQTVVHVVFTHQRPLHFAHLFAVEEHRIMAGVRR